MKGCADILRIFLSVIAYWTRFCSFKIEIGWIGGGGCVVLLKITYNFLFVQYFHGIFFLMRILHQIHFPERTFTYKIYYLKIIDRDSWLIDNSLLDICLFLSRSINMLFDVLHRITLFYLIAVHDIDTWLLTSKF